MSSTNELKIKNLEGLLKNQEEQLRYCTNWVRYDRIEDRILEIKNKLNELKP